MVMPAKKVSADMDMSSPPHPPALSHVRLVRIWMSVLGGHEFLDGYEFLVDVSADMDMSSPTHPPTCTITWEMGRRGAASNNWWPLFTASANLPLVLSPTQGLLYMPGQGKK